ncbi:hypothetical protein ACLOJK_024395 [Asimina triloba]
MTTITMKKEKDDTMKDRLYEELSFDFAGYDVNCVRAKSDAGGNEGLQAHEAKVEHTLGMPDKCSESDHGHGLKMR